MSEPSKETAPRKAREPGRTPGSAESGGQDEPGRTWTEPGRTPGSAEGDRETVEEDLRKKGLQ